jgi:hypothetical protein
MAYVGTAGGVVSLIAQNVTSDELGRRRHKTHRDVIQVTGAARGFLPAAGFVISLTLNREHDHRAKAHRYRK